MPSCWKPRQSTSIKNQRRHVKMNKEDKKSSFKNKKAIPDDIPIIWVNI